MKPIGTTQELWLKSLGFKLVPDYLREGYFVSFFPQGARMVSRQLSAGDVTFTYLVDSKGAWWMTGVKTSVGGFVELEPVKLEGSLEEVVTRGFSRLRERAKKMN